MQKVSVVIPVYNSAKTIRRSLESLKHQTFKDFETVIVDNNCTDSSMAIVNDYVDDLSVRIVQCKTQGIVPALNTGLHEANCDLIARQDADDYWYPDKLQKQVEFLEKNQNVSILGTQIRLLDESGNPQELGTYNRPVKYPLDDMRIKQMLLLGQNPLCHPSVIFRKEVPLVVGGYSRFFHLAEDLHLWTRALPFFNFANLEETLIDYTQTIRSDYNPNTPLICSTLYFEMYKAAGIVTGERPKILYEWQVEGDKR